jgi:hypothetical protein
MARGWESKAVEEQIASAEERRIAAVPPVPADQRERQVRRDGLMLSRARLLADIENARDARYRETLSRALAFIDEQLGSTKIHAGEHKNPRRGSTKSAKL